MKNPREAFGALVSKLLAAKELSENQFALGMAKRLGIRGKYAGYVNQVVHGQKVPPVENRDTWATALGLEAGTAAYREFAALHDAALAWGKADGRAHIERLEKANRALHAENARLTRLLEREARRLTDSDSQLAAVSKKVRRPLNPGGQG
jgi:hypothetical protein